MESYRVSKELLLPACYLPPIYCFPLIAASKHITLDRHEHFIKQTYRNRCRIPASNGLLDLSIPVVRDGRLRTPAGMVKISGDGNWRRLHWRAFESAYNSSPYFLYYRDDFERILFDEGLVRLFDLNLELFKLVLHLLNIEVGLSLTDSFQKDAKGYTDLREFFHPHKSFARMTFTHGSIRLEEYHQVFSDRIGFQPGVSIADLLFNLGPDAGPYVLRHAELLRLDRSGPPSASPR